MNKQSMCRIGACVAVLMAGILGARAQDQGFQVEKRKAEVESPELDAFRSKLQQQYPNMDVSVRSETRMVGDLSPRPIPQSPMNVAVFVRNQSRNKLFDDEVDSIRDLISAELAAQGMIVMDKDDVIAGFHRFKVTTDEERDGLIAGLFDGGSALRMAQALGVDYFVLVSLNYADKRVRQTGGGDPVAVYSSTMSVKVLEGQKGSSVYGDIVKQTYPSTSGNYGGTEDTTYYHDLFAQSAGKIATGIAASAATWRRVPTRTADQVAFKVSTTIDTLINGLQEGARGPNDVLDELRHVVGGVTVELDGMALGSSPGTFYAEPGSHQLRLTRQWMDPWQKTVMIQEGSTFDVAMELSAAGMQRHQSMEGLKASIALTYADAAYRKGIKINFDTAAWQQVSIGGQGDSVNVNTQQVQ